MFAACLLLAAPAAAQDAVTEWASVAVPPAVEPRAVTAEPATTALLMLDFMNQNCGRRPRCVASVPRVRALLEQARARNVLVVYSFIANTGAADVMAGLEPRDGEPTVQAGPNKFLGTELQNILRARNIRRVITVGTAANGAVLATASHAAYLGLDVIAPADGISAEGVFPELYTLWHLANAPALAMRTTITRTTMIGF
jgi:nicotinamidase-related amidase